MTDCHYCDLLKPTLYSLIGISSSTELNNYLWLYSLYFSRLVSVYSELLSGS